MATMAVAPSARAETTGSVASSFDHLPQKAKEKQKAKAKEVNDPLKVLDPARKKLSSVESQRVISVLDDTIRRIEIGSLLPFIAENLERYSVILGSELSLLISEHDKLQHAYQKAVSKFELEQKRARSASPQTSVSTPASSRRGSVIEGEESQTPGTPTVQKTSRTSSVASAISSHKSGRSARSSDIGEVDAERVQQLSMMLQQSLRTLLRQFSRNPTAMTAIRTERHERSFESNSMIDELSAIRAVLFERLLTTPSELKDRDKYLMAVAERQKRSSQMADKLQDELQNAIDDRDNEIAKRNEIIRRLKNDIFNVDKNAEEQNKRIVTEASKQDAAEMKNSDGKKAKLQQELIETKKKLEAQTVSHRESELALRKRKYKIETEVENWIQKFDNDMGERQDEFDALDVVYTEEKKQLQELEERFKTLEAEYVQIVEERRIAKEKAEAAERELNLKIRAARLIQAMWRAHKARKALQKKKKKGKKGKKGKKSGKKKK
ncbi:dynein regulatory complex protein 10 [Nematostella vectensis]|uniref:dynein regulatory complex protein 10 n=1 Tax=Nematostella vectensis TaxID=45351 RepID=UPI002077427F|nr:dynein regulatory complex protein 10 [Nematostella vectensis]